jgi:translation initiation factor IF-1
MAEAVRGVVEELRPQGLYLVRCDSGLALLATWSPGGRRAAVKLIPGDRVSIEISPRDPTRGRIQGRL